jgi:hypothetical protein
MKTRYSLGHSRLFFVLIGLAVGLNQARSAPLGTAFTYQGRLADGGTPAAGSYDLKFSLFDAATGGAPAGIPTTLTLVPVEVTNGLFTVALDFGGTAFSGGARWLEIAVRTNGAVSAHTILSPRQPLTPAPYALYAPTAGTASSAATASSVPWSALTGLPAGFADGIDNDTTYSAGAGLTLSGTLFSVNFGGSGAALTASRSDHLHSASDITSGVLADARIPTDVARLSTDETFTGRVTFNPPFSAPFFVFSAIKVENLNVDYLDGLDSSAFWKLGGNSGIDPRFHYLGTTDNKPIELKVFGARALRLEPAVASPNLIGGYQDNLVIPGVSGATISGGGQLGLAHTVIGDFGTIGGGFENVASSLGTVGGGRKNQATALHASVGGGAFNTASGTASGVGGGQVNAASGDFASISGGLGNAAGFAATVSGGTNNTASGAFATVAGGRWNTAAGDFSFAAGNRAAANHHGSFVWADSPGFFDPLFASTSADQFLIRARGGVGIGTASPTKALDVRDGTGAFSDGGGIHVGGTGANGDAKLINFGDGDFVHIGENLADDTLELKATRFYFNNGNVGIGTVTPGVKLDVLGEARVSVLTITGGADVAEPFQMSARDIPQGAVVVIDEKNPGHLAMSDRAYDHRVAGIVSGANGVKPGLTLHQEGVLEGGQNVALSGRVYVLADAANAPIQPGDLLTTSPVPGHAMKVTDHVKAQGSILGKAMGSLAQGRGMVLVLVSLQ